MPSWMTGAVSEMREMHLSGRLTHSGSCRPSCRGKCRLVENNTFFSRLGSFIVGIRFRAFWKMSPVFKDVPQTEHKEATNHAASAAQLFVVLHSIWVSGFCNIFLLIQFLDAFLCVILQAGSPPPPPTSQPQSQLVSLLLLSGQPWYLPLCRHGRVTN